MERLWPTLRPLVGAAGLQWEGRDVQQIQGVKRCQGVDDDSGWTFDVSWPWLVDSWRAYPLIVNNQWFFSMGYLARDLATTPP